MMDATLTPTEKRLSAREAQALRIRYKAALSLLPDVTTDEERWDLLGVVVWPSHPLLGLTSPTSSATG